MTEVARTEVFAFDADGNPVEPGSAEAATGEAVEYDADGNVLRRMYLTNRAAPDPDPVDTALSAAPGEWTLPDTLESLIEFLGGQQQDPDRLHGRVATVTLLPSWENAPATLQRQVYAYLAG